jgi:hypothetical protein
LTVTFFQGKKVALIAFLQAFSGCAVLVLPLFRKVEFLKSITGIKNKLN